MNLNAKPAETLPVSSRRQNGQPNLGRTPRSSGAPRPCVRHMRLTSAGFKNSRSTCSWGGGFRTHHSTPLMMTSHARKIAVEGVKEEKPGWPEDAGRFGDGVLRMFQVLEKVHRADDIEGRIVKRQPQRVAFLVTDRVPQIVTRRHSPARRRTRREARDPLMTERAQVGSRENPPHT